ncbi:hypothetical protein [Comamonas sp. BIGb0124]|nr:hypothetical protein [Comamonas sp. BIGb0124]
MQWRQLGLVVAGLQAGIGHEVDMANNQTKHAFASRDLRQDIPANYTFD